ncbi:hypothetical protein H2248_004001 [Termitomyces sp. 'cryptogamus']|nr:hypothetical protein H2248_004001 [Termitomyces sp. 'cryptogamus']
MGLHGIRAVGLRIDISLNDDNLERAATALIPEGWIELSLAVPPTNGGFWMAGFKEFMALGRRLQYPMWESNVEQTILMDRITDNIKKLNLNPG